MRVSIIVAVAANGVIGRGGRLPWHLADDLRRFKRLTMGHTLIMGRRTWESIGRPLPGRRMIVVSRRPDYRAGVPGVDVARSLETALQLAAAAGDDEVFVIGGAEVFRDALPRANRLHWTRIHANVEGDVSLPAIPWHEWRLIESDSHAADAQNEHPFTFEVYERFQAGATSGNG
jgi:dihydrofolate reductase